MKGVATRIKCQRDLVTGDRESIYWFWWNVDNQGPVSDPSQEEVGLHVRSQSKSEIKEEEREGSCVLQRATETVFRAR